MNNLPFSFIVSLLAIFTIPRTIDAQKATGYYIKSVTATVQGTSNLHDWESSINKIEWTGDFQTNGTLPSTVNNVVIKIHVKGIKSKEGKIMDRKTYEAFKSEKNPYIIYAFTGAPVKVDSMQVTTIESSGNLTMAGVTKPVTVSAHGKLLGNGDIQLSGSKKLNMLDFNMEPPSAVLGTIHVGNEVTVNFNITIAKTKKQTKSTYKL